MAMTASRTRVFAGVSGGVYRSDDDGTTWEEANVGLTNPYVFALAVTDNAVFVGTSGGGAFRSTDDGASWTPVNDGLTNNVVFALAAGGGNVYAGTSGGGVYRSQDGGDHWTQVNNGLTGVYLRSLVASGSNVFAATATGIFYSADDGDHWTAINQNLVYPNMNAIAISGSNLLTGAYYNAAWRSPLPAAVAVPEIDPSLPAGFALAGAAPNPALGATAIAYSLAEPARVTLTLFDPAGRRVADLVDAFQGAGPHEARVDTAALPPGVYFYRLRAGAVGASGRLTVVR
jgi:photosystem II stability/assembly factor-like uncharacterized protein